MALKPSKENSPSSQRKFSLKLWLGIPFALFLVLLVILSQIDLESVKEELVQRISEETGLKVEMESIGFGFSHGLGLQGKGVKVSTPEGDQYSVDRLDLLAAWSPLLKGEFKIKSAALEHPVLKLEISKTQKEPTPTEKEKPADMPGLVDAKTLESTTQKIKDSPLSIDKFVISDAEITLTRPGSTKQLLLNVDGTFVLNRDEGMDISAKDVKVQTGALTFEGDGMVSNLNTDDGKIAINLKTGGFSLATLQPTLQFFEVSTKGSPLEAVDVKRLLFETKFPLNSLSQIEALKKNITGSIDLKIHNAILNIGDRYTLESLEGEGIWDNGTLAHEFSGKALGSDFKLNGKLPFSGPGTDSVSRFEWKSLDLKKLPLKKGLPWSPTQGMVSGNVSLTGPITKETNKLKAAVEFQVADLVLKSATEARPIEMSRLNGRGNFDKGQLQHDVQGTIWGSDFDIKGSLRLPPANPILDSSISWKELDVAQLPLPKGSGWHPTQGKVSGIVKLKGPVPEKDEGFPGRIKGSLKFNAQNLKLESADSAPLSLSQLEGEGDIGNNRVNYKVSSGIFNGTINSDGNITLPASESAKLVLDNKIELTNLDLSQLPIPTTIEKGNISGTIKLKGPLPDPENFLTSNLKVDTSFKVGDLSMPTDSLPLKIQNLEGKATLQKGRLVHDLNGNLFGGKMAVKGNLAFHKNKITADSNLVLNQINLNGFSQFHKSAPSSGTLTGNLKIRGPLLSEGKISPDLKLNGTLEGNKLVLEDRQIESAKVDFKTAGTTQAQVELEKINLGDRNFKKVSAHFNITSEKIVLTNGKVWPMSGLINLAGNLKPESGSYSMKFKGDKLKVEELLPEKLKGPLQFFGALTGTLPQGNAAPGLPDYSRDLSGNIKLKLVDGAIPQLGAVEGLLTILNPTTALNAQKEGLSYEYMGGDFKIIKGVVHTDNFEMKSPQVNMNVVGKANLVEDSVLAQVKAMPLQMLDKTLKAIPLLGQILGGGKKGGLIEIYVKVDGKLSSPSYMPLPHKSLTEKPGNILKGIINLPENLTGGK
ncbi:MAG: hypothetical protein HN472_17235 [Nitrospina sp.]|jgi:hypothetical protein|nr:hypothetical protein [Nitrospina sp.]MBT3511274.1 hypothetical protein [Nitrospina sp.]MBT3877127.1 hypothetical protein [Nitrospina sp.]MBT4047502.1 hypothetical protein [Nitrospina sp.]MBT5347182.1 hypothetical protein [Nitrospina sp.]